MTVTWYCSWDHTNRPYRYCLPCFKKLISEILETSSSMATPNHVPHRYSEIHAPGRWLDSQFLMVLHRQIFVYHLLPTRVKWGATIQSVVSWNNEWFNVNIRSSSKCCTHSAQVCLCIPINPITHSDWAIVYIWFRHCGMTLLLVVIVHVRI